MRGIKLIIFDLDGTLVDAYPAITASFNHTMRVLDYPRIQPQVIRRSVGWGDRNLLKPFINKEDLDRALVLYRRHHRLALSSGARLYPGTKKILIYLKKKGYKLAVASNRPTRFSRILIRHLYLDQYLDYVLCADRLKNIKPHPEILNQIMAKFGLGPQEVIFVGDMAIDGQAGRRAKVKTVLVLTGSNSEDELKAAKPYRLIRSLRALLNIL